jgi:DNA-binding HxlR family transcriptional regulator
MRAGSKALAFFSYSLHAKVLRAHAEGPLRPGDLEEKISWAPQSSLRLAVSTLSELGILSRHEDEGAQGAVTALTEAGRELLPVADTLERWLQLAPDGPIPLDDDAARGIVRVLTAGWDSTMVRALAERPLTLNEISADISDLSYPALKRRLTKLRATRLVEPARSQGMAAYGASDWLRLAVVPLAVAGRWERKHDPEAEPISPVEVEAAFLLTLPFLQLPVDAVGSCTLAVLTSEDKSEGGPEVAGVAIVVDRGKVVSCTSEARSRPTTWALGTTEAWLDAVIGGHPDGLRVRGTKTALARQVIGSLHDTLFHTV